MKLAITETGIKNMVKDYLAIKGIYNYPILQGLGAHRGVPDRIMHYQDRVHYLEIKVPGGKLSEYQEAFRLHCAEDNIPYHVITSLEDLQAIVG